jgi:ribonuclease HI
MKDTVKKVITTYSLSTLMAASDKKKQRIRKPKLLEQEGVKITLLWVHNHAGIQVNEETDNLAKESLDDNVGKTDEDPSQDLANWMTQQQLEQQQRK